MVNPVKSSIHQFCHVPVHLLWGFKGVIWDGTCKRSAKTFLVQGYGLTSSGVDDLSFEKWHSLRNSNQAKHLPILSHKFLQLSKWSKLTQPYPCWNILGVLKNRLVPRCCKPGLHFISGISRPRLTTGGYSDPKQIMHSSAAVLRLQTPYQVRHLPKWSVFFSAKLGQERNGDGSKPWYLSPSGQEPCSHLSSIY